MKKPNPDDSRENLELFAKQLRALMERELCEQQSKQFPPSISPDLGEFIAGAIEQYLSGKYDSLDHALGLVEKPGRRRTQAAAEKQEQQARRIFALRLRGVSWKDITGQEGGDERGLRRLYDRHKWRLMGEVIDLDLSLHPGDVYSPNK